MLIRKLVVIVAIRASVKKMDNIVLIINNQTNGAVPIKSELSIKDDKFLIKCNGDYGFTVEVSIDAILTVLNNESE